MACLTEKNMKLQAKQIHSKLPSFDGKNIKQSEIKVKLIFLIRIRKRKMTKKLWMSRFEFYPYISIYFFWFSAAFMTSLAVKNRPGIFTLGLITVPSILLITIAFIKTIINITTDFESKKEKSKFEPVKKIIPIKEKKKALFFSHGLFLF